MRLLCVTVLILGFTSGVYMETCPSDEDISPCTCEEDDESGDLMVNCQDESLDLETLRQALNSLSGKNDVDLFLGDLELGKLPSNFFYGIGIKKLELDHCSLDSLTNDNQPGLLGLESYLEELIILGSFTEENGKTKLNLGHLKKLRELDLSFNAITEIGDDWFSNGPSSLEILVISNCGVEKIGNNAFSQLNNLKELSLHGNRFGPIKRSMLPSTADRLETLELDNNALTDIPKDIFSRMPSISSISLRTNGFTTLDERTWSPIWQQLKDLRLEGNDIHCDGRLNWIFKSKPRPYVFGRCSAPEEFEGQNLEEFFRSRSR